MNTLIIPCAGKSSRFPGMRPKYLLTHPDGSLMVVKSLSGIICNGFDRVIITIVKEHIRKYEADKWILEACHMYKPHIELCILDEFTSSAAETVFQTLIQANVHGSFVVKDSDNYFNKILQYLGHNFVIGFDARSSNVSNLSQKSFLDMNEQCMLLRIEEKNIISNYICIGCYGFESSLTYISSYNTISKRFIDKELYLSHMVSYLLSHSENFMCDFSTFYEDYGSIEEWRALQQRMKTIFIDFDGVLINNSGQYGKINWDTNLNYNIDNLNTLKILYDKGAQVIITTSRPDKYNNIIINKLNEFGIEPYGIINGLHHAPRLIINDFASSNKFPSAEAISIPRDGFLKDYI